MKNFAYIDGSNLYNGIKKLDWEFDYARFRIWLKDKYKVEEAYMFLGRIDKLNDLYLFLKECGYKLVFKKVITRKGKIKGNCDSDIVVNVMKSAYKNDFYKAILTTSDGDFAPLVDFLLEENKLETIISPYKTKKCSILLKRTGAKISYINDQKSILQKEKAPSEDETSQGSFS